MLDDNANTYLEDEELHGGGIVLAIGEGGDLLVGLLEESLEVLVALAEDLEARLVESSRLGAAGSAIISVGCRFNLHLPANLSLLALLLVLSVYCERLLAHNLGLWSVESALGIDV